MHANKRCRMDPLTIWQQPKLITRTRKKCILSAGMKKNTHTIDRKHVAPWIMASLQQPNSVVCYFASPNNLRTRWEFTGLCVCVCSSTAKLYTAAIHRHHICISTRIVCAGKLHFHTWNNFAIVACHVNNIYANVCAVCARPFSVVCRPFIAYFVTCIERQRVILLLCWITKANMTHDNNKFLV